jgi:predicted ATPase/class 3 adenylate cyclase
VSRDAATGTVTLLFTDIEGSTRLLHQLGDRYVALLDDHHRLLDAAASGRGGRRVDAAGDGLFYSFESARGAVQASVEAQRAVLAHPWPDGVAVRSRMGLHTGEPIASGAGYVGMDVHRAARICAAGHGGQILASESVRSLIGGSLPDDVTLRDLGEHRLKDLASPERLHQVLAPGLPADFPAIKSLDTLPNNLPRQLSEFIGREGEVETVVARLGEGSVVTLTGPGGVGKTRLALEVGARMIDAFPDGVWLVELAALVDPALVAEAVVAALRIRQPPGADARDVVTEWLASRRALLVIDNCEHVLDAVVDLADALLHRCSELTVLATSREAMGIAGESIVHVPSMSVPADAGGGRVAIEEVAACDAVRLFVDRARGADPAFAVSETNAAAIAEICRRLDGIPLAVELAAARVRALPPQEIARRLNDRFRLLTGGSRTALPRHRTLRAAMDWSFDLLPAEERILLARLSVFVGSFSIEAAEAVGPGGIVDRNDVLDLLTRLVDRSLLLPADEASEARYRMLETVRDYAQERLAELGDASETFGRHRDWFAALVQEARPAFLAGPEQSAWLDRLSRDHDNVRAALGWTHEDPDGAATELAMGSGLWRFWEIRGHLVEGGAWLERALNRSGGEASAIRANALTGAGVLAAHRGDLPAATRFHEAALTLHRQLGEPRSVAAASSNLANISAEQGDIERARRLYAEAIEASATAGDRHGEAYSLINLADLAAREGQADEADTLYARSVSLFEELGDRWGVAHATSRIALVARRRGDLAVARERYEDARSAFEAMGDRRGVARTVMSLGDLAALENDLGKARAGYAASLALRHELGDRAGVASVLERLAGIEEGDPERAARLIGMAAGLREVIGATLGPAAAAELERFLAGLRDRIGSEALREALDVGRRTPLGAGVAEILAGQPIESASRPPAPA